MGSGRKPHIEMTFATPSHTCNTFHSQDWGMGFHDICPSKWTDFCYTREWGFAYGQIGPNSVAHPWPVGERVCNTENVVMCQVRDLFSTVYLLNRSWDSSKHRPCQHPNHHPVPSLTCFMHSPQHHEHRQINILTPHLDVSKLSSLLRALYIRSIPANQVLRCQTPGKLAGICFFSLMVDRFGIKILVSLGWLSNVLRTCSFD